MHALLEYLILNYARRPQILRQSNISSDIDTTIGLTILTMLIRSSSLARFGGSNPTRAIIFLSKIRTIENILDSRNAF